MGFLKNKPVKQTDEELLQNYKLSGESSYFGQLYDRYIPLVYGVCLKYLKNADLAEDAVMQLFEQLLPKVLRHDIQVFRTWLYRVVQNHCLQILREKDRRAQVEFCLDFMESDDVLYLLDEEDNNERVQALQECMEKLPENQRVTIVRFFMDEMSYADIADTTGFHLKSVKSYIQNGKRNLKNCMEQTCKIG